MAEYPIELDGDDVEGWGASIPALRVFAVAPTRVEVLHEVRDAAAFHLGGLAEDLHPAPDPGSPSGTRTTLTVRIRDEQLQGIWATVDEIPGVFGSGFTLEELADSLRDGLVLVGEPAAAAAVSIDDLR